MDKVSVCKARKGVIPVQVLLPREYITALDEVATAASESRSTIVRQAVKALIDQKKLQEAA